MKLRPPYQHLRERIFRDFWVSAPVQVGSRLPPERELARQYDVSTNTVAKSISALENEGWLTKRQGSGIYVAALANSATARGPSRQRRIGCIVSSLRLTLAHRVFQGVERVARERRCVVEVAASEGDSTEERRQVEAMRQRGIQGIVLYPTVKRAPEGDYLATDFRDFPMVVADLYQPSMKRPHLIFDNWTAGRDMTRWLLERGHQRIAFLKFDAALPYRSVDDRAAGYCRAMSDTNVPEQLLTYPWQASQPKEHARALQQAMKQFLALTPRPTALIVPDDYRAHATVMFLRSQGVKVPEEVCVTGFDNLQEETWGARFPSTNPDFVRLGERAAETLLECIATRHCEASGMVLPCPVVIPPEPTTLGSSVVAADAFCPSLALS